MTGLLDIWLSWHLENVDGSAWNGSNRVKTLTSRSLLRLPHENPVCVAIIESLVPHFLLVFRPSCSSIYGKKLHRAAENSKVNKISTRFWIVVTDDFVVAMNMTLHAFMIATQQS